MGAKERWVKPGRSRRAGPLAQSPVWSLVEGGCRALGSCRWGDSEANMAAGGYFHVMVVKAKAGELNLARTIWGLRSEARQAGQGQHPERSN